MRHTDAPPPLPHFDGECGPSAVAVVPTTAAPPTPFGAGGGADGHHHLPPDRHAPTTSGGGEGGTPSHLAGPGGLPPCGPRWGYRLRTSRAPGGLPPSTPEAPDTSLLGSALEDTIHLSRPWRTLNASPGRAVIGPSRSEDATPGPLALDPSRSEGDTCPADWNCARLVLCPSRKGNNLSRDSLQCGHSDMHAPRVNAALRRMSLGSPSPDP